MSVLLLTNPFAQPQTPPPNPAPEPPAQGTAPAAPSAPGTVQPSQQSNTNNKGGSATSKSGSGAGAGGAASQLPLRSASTPGRPQGAAPSSIINAQVSDARAETLARPAAIGQMERQRDSDLVAGIGGKTETRQAEMTVKPAPVLPDPLPTSPFLKRTGS